MRTLTSIFFLLLALPSLGQIEIEENEEFLHNLDIYILSHQKNVNTFMPVVYRVYINKRSEHYVISLMTFKELITIKKGFQGYFLTDEGRPVVYFDSSKEDAKIDLEAFAEEYEQYLDEGLMYSSSPWLIKVRKGRVKKLKKGITNRVYRIYSDQHPFY